MIVNCPNCSLEQPLDPFCAGCGKQLPKLIAEQKRRTKTRNKRSQKIIIGSIALFCFGFYLYYAYQNPGARLFSQESKEPRVKLTMSKSTIKASKFQEKEFSKPLKVKSFALADKTEVEAKPKPAAPALKEQKTALPSFAVQEVYLINTEDCTNGEIEPGPLSIDELAFFLDCSKVLFKLGSDETTDVDSNLPFANSVTFKTIGKRISLIMEFRFEEPAFTTTQSLGLSQTTIRKAGYIGLATKNKSAANYIVEKRPLIKREMLESHAASSLLGLSSDDKPSPKGYFLAVYE